MMTSMGTGTGSLERKRSLSSFTANTTPMMTSEMTTSHTLVEAMSRKMISRV